MLKSNNREALLDEFIYFLASKSCVLIFKELKNITIWLSKTSIDLIDCDCIFVWDVLVGDVLNP